MAEEMNMPTTRRTLLSGSNHNIEVKTHNGNVSGHLLGYGLYEA